MEGLQRVRHRVGGGAAPLTDWLHVNCPKIVWGVFVFE